MCCCQIIEKTTSLSLEQRTSSQADRKWNMSSEARTQQIKSASPLELDANKICATIEEGKISSNLPLSQTVSCQKKETRIEEAATGL